MTDPVAITTLLPEPLVQFEIWGDPAAVERRLGWELPKAGRSALRDAARLMWWEPHVWVVRGPLADLTSALAEDGAAIEVTGAFSRLRVTGEGWRELLTIGGVFDAESPAFAPGCIAGTVIHHLPVRLDVIDAQTVDAYTPPSYAAELAYHWEAGARRIGVGAR